MEFICDFSFVMGTKQGQVTGGHLYHLGTRDPGREHWVLTLCVHR